MRHTLLATSTASFVLLLPSAGRAQAVNPTTPNNPIAYATPAANALIPEDPLQRLDDEVERSTHKKLDFTFEERTRWEEKDGVNFGKSVNQQDMLSRLRIGAIFQPVSWFKISAMGQDARAPFYGNGAPNTLRAPMDLQEAYVELFGQTESGFGATFGREMLNYGESRLIGSPQWSNLSRTFDTGRMNYRAGRARFEILMVSPVKIVPGTYDTPELGERIVGTYNTFSSILPGTSADAYFLDHSQNKIGGWTGAGTLDTQSYGGRLFGSLPHHFVYNLEGVDQTGHMGLLTQRAFAFAGGAARKVSVGRPLNFSVEYKEASGTRPGETNSGTFDQLSPSNHDKFGHEDLFGWRNLKTAKSLETLELTRSLALNVMYTDDWLYSAADSLYNSAGSSIALSKKGTAGTHVGQELDSFVTYKVGPHLLGAGFGHFFKGEFIAQTTRDVNPRYFYVFQQYSFR
ncbi:MAG TPA: alginate export family protein [Bryobacteraceae bacterium]|jgi:hypothetical protein